MLFIYNIWVCITAAVAIASYLSAFYLFRFKRRFGSYIAMSCLSVAAEASIAAITMGMLPAPRIGLWAVVARLTGRLLEAIALAVLALYLLGYINGRGNPPIES